MTEGIVEQLLFEPEELLPEAWRHLDSGPLNTFNPGLERSADGTWILAYRVVGADGRRRIGICRLDARFRVITGSIRALSDELVFRRPNSYPQVTLEWFADPRLVRLRGRLFVYWNSGWHEPCNHQFIQEVDETHLRPLGTARELLLVGAERRKLEKNWMLFEHGGRVLLIYSVQPHRVLECELTGTGDIACREIASAEWIPESYPACHGGLRGGAPPQLAEGRLWSICHTVHDGPEGYVYRAAAYAFSPAAPFAPILAPVTPLTLHRGPLPARRHPPLNPAVAEVIYPCGVQRTKDEWVVTWGLNDERCALTLLAHSALVATTVSAQPIR